MDELKNHQGHLFIISAPSGTGKTTVSQAVVKRLSVQYHLSIVITHTTREPRGQEVTGQDYHFVSRDEFLRKQAAGFFLETTEYNNNFYGSPASIKTGLLQGKSFVLVPDRAGAIRIRELFDAPVLIWLEPPSLEELRCRLELRGHETAEQIERRLVIARQEMAAEKEQPIFDHHIVNDNFEDTVNKVCSIIQQTLSI